MKSTIITFPGVNRERDMAMAIECAGAPAPTLIRHTETALPPSDLIVIPGGFAYGDYLRAGAMAARAPVMQAVMAAAGRGVAVLGVCNGFQVLTETGLLPGALMRNAGLNFICRDVKLRVENTDSLFTADYAPGAILSIPSAHNDGNYYADAATLARLEGEGRVAFRYVNPANETADEATNEAAAPGDPAQANPAPTNPAQANPNGSAHAIAGVLNARQNVLGIMPHPENATDPILGGTDGRPLFQSIARVLK